MIDQFVREQRQDLRQLNTLIRFAGDGMVENFESYFANSVSDDLLQRKVSFLKEKAEELYVKDLETRAFREEFQERPDVGARCRWNVQQGGRVPEWVVENTWNDQEFYRDYVSKLLVLEVEQKERNILGAQGRVSEMSR
ncbi:MAG: hypothetical protein AB7G93_13375 [Bdellovibrionales bacterium]